MRNAYVLIMALALMGCASKQLATPFLDPTYLTADDANAVVMIKADKGPMVSEYFYGYHKEDYIWSISIYPYDQVNQKMPRVETGMTVFTGRLVRGGFQTVKLKPGTYAYKTFRQQGKWGLCFHSGTYSFEVKAGEFLYLGELDIYGQLNDIQNKASESGHLKSKGLDWYTYFDDVRPPMVDTDKGYDLAQQHAETNWKNIAVPLKKVEYQPASFGLKKTLGSTFCGDGIIGP